MLQANGAGWKTGLRRLRGLVGVGLFSGVAWACIGALLGTAVLVIDPAVVDAGEGPGWIAYYFGRAGFVAGIVAGALLALAESRRSFEKLRYGRLAVWGALGGLVLPWLAVAPLPMVPMFIVLGAGTSCAALAIARRGNGPTLLMPAAERGSRAGHATED